MDKLKRISLTLLFVVALGLLALWFRARGRDFTGNFNRECVKERDLLAQDDEMTGLIANGQAFHILENYYSCNPLRRGEIVAIKGDESQPAMARIIRAVPGDRVELLPFPQEDAFVLRIQGEILMGADNKSPQRFGVGQLQKKEKIHPLFKQDAFQLKENEFLAFSYVMPSQNDSFTFGPIPSERILGRVVLPNR